MISFHSFTSRCGSKISLRRIIQSAAAAAATAVAQDRHHFDEILISIKLQRILEDLKISSDVKISDENRNDTERKHAEKLREAERSQKKRNKTPRRHVNGKWRRRGEGGRGKGEVGMLSDM